MGRVKVAVGGYDRRCAKFNKNLEYLKNWEFSFRIYMQKAIPNKLQMKKKYIEVLFLFSPSYSSCREKIRSSFIYQE